MKIKSGVTWGLFVVLAACGGQPEVERTSQIDLEAVDPEGQEIVFWYQHTREREEALQKTLKVSSKALLDAHRGFQQVRSTQRAHEHEVTGEKTQRFLAARSIGHFEDHGHGLHLEIFERAMINGQAVPLRVHLGDRAAAHRVSEAGHHPRARRHACRGAGRGACEFGVGYRGKTPRDP